MYFLENKEKNTATMSEYEHRPHEGLEAMVCLLTRSQSLRLARVLPPPQDWLAAGGPGLSTSDRASSCI
jgi:hypothetical protein